MDIKKSTIGVIIGRFQIHQLHKAHVDLIDFVRNRHDKVIIFLGVSDAICTRKHPLDFLTRKMMLEATIGNQVTILPLKDDASDALWSKNLDSKVREVFPSGTVTLYGSRDSFIPYYKGHFPTMELEPDTYVSATDIRESISHKVVSSEEFRAGIIYCIYNSYPMVYSTVDVAIVKENMILLGQKPGENKWRFVGGFVDVTDPTEEAAARRETLEETGLEVGDVTFICSQRINDWRYKNMKDRGVMTHFYMAKYVFGGPQPNDDICALKWFPIEKATIDQVLPGHIGLFEKLLTFINND